MKKLILALSVLLFASLASAQTITCSASGATAKQASQYATFLARINAERAAQKPPLPTFAGFPEHCASVMLSLFQSYVGAQTVIDSAKVAAAAEAKGDEVAPTGQCTVAGLAAGCTKAQVVCWVLTGNTGCN